MAFSTLPNGPKTEQTSERVTWHETSLGVDVKTLSDYLAVRSREICADNGCTDAQHNCESYAYIDANMNLLDVCYPDYFQGTSKPHAAIMLPWTGTQAELEAEVADQCAEMAG